MKKLEEVNEQLKADLEKKEQAKAVAAEAKENKAEEDEAS